MRLSGNTMHTVPSHGYLQQVHLQHVLLHYISIQAAAVSQTYTLFNILPISTFHSITIWTASSCYMGN